MWPLCNRRVAYTAQINKKPEYKIYTSLTTSGKLSNLSRTDGKICDYTVSALLLCDLSPFQCKFEMASHWRWQVDLQ